VAEGLAVHFGEREERQMRGLGASGGGVVLMQHGWADVWARWWHMDTKWRATPDGGRPLTPSMVAIRPAICT
jgi:hypothetical protein